MQSITPFDSLSDAEIRTAIRNATGPRASLFVPEVSFEILVKRQIKRLEQPVRRFTRTHARTHTHMHSRALVDTSQGLQCVDLVYDELHRLTSMCEPPELQRFPELRDRVVDVVHVMLRERLKPTQT